MLITGDIRTSSYDQTRWVINTPSGRNLIVTHTTLQFFELLRHAPTFEQGLVAFNATFNAGVSLPEFQSLVTDRFGGYQLLSHEENGSRPPVVLPSIKLRIQLLSPAVAGWLAAPLRPFFAPRAFWWIFLTLAAFLIVVCCTTPTLSPLSNQYWSLLPLIYGSVIVHELGHIAACARAGVKHGHVGFGFYLYLLPALYADISNIWLANRHQRIIANLGGIFSQFIYAAVLAVGYLLTGQALLVVAASTIAVMALWQFNPFIQADGYWILSDLTATPNLLVKASATFRRGCTWSQFRRLLADPVATLRHHQLLLFLYGAVNAGFMVVITCFVALQHGTLLWHFPDLALTLLAKLRAGTLVTSDFDHRLLMSLFFYSFVIRTIYVKGWHYLKKRAIQ